MLIILGLLLLFLIVVIGGDRGVVSIISLCGNMLFLSLAIWLMAAGAPVLLVTVGAAVIISCITLFYQNGTNVKTKSAFIATLLTMTVLFVFIYIIVWSSETGGLNEIQAAEEDVLYYNMDLDINMRNVAIAVIILSTLGAVLDMALTVTTSVYEISIHKPDMSIDEINRKWNTDWKRSNRNNSEYITICLSWRIFIAIFVFEDAELYAGNIIEFKNTVSELCIYDIWCDCMRYCDADGGIIDR